MANVAKQVLKSLNTRLLSLSPSLSVLRRGYVYNKQNAVLNFANKMPKQVSPVLLNIGHRFTHTEAEKGDRELVEYLSEEIKAETENIVKQLPNIPGFEVKCNGAELVFLKQFGKENIQISLNVNNSVEADYTLQEDEDVPPPMVCRPQFLVEVSKGNETMSFNCTFNPVDGGDLPDGDDSLPPGRPEQAVGRGEYEDKEQVSGGMSEDLFTIDDVSVYSGERADLSVYSMNGDVMDGEMYDRLMDYLADRGIDVEFSKTLTEFCTMYENQQYVGILGMMKQFIAK